MAAADPDVFNQLQQLRAQLRECMGEDKHVLRRHIDRLKSDISQGEVDKSAFERSFQSLYERVERSINRVKSRRQNVPGLSYPPLPVTDQKDTIANAIRDHQVVIIAGETGSGKTTQIPKICLELGRGISGLIGHTQPRRLAARTVANRIAEEMNTPLGEQVGFKIRFSDQVAENTYIKLMTDGILLAEIQNDKFLNQYDTLIIDEAHERSLNIDFILGYLKQLLPKRPDLKVIITSATIDPERFSSHFGDAPIIEVSGRTYPVEMRYRPLDDPEQDRDQTQGILDAVKELQREGPGDILVFLSGEREIRDTADALQKAQLRGTDILPLYARLSSTEQNRVFQGHTGRRVVLATNVAETSLTVPGIKYVIDPGMARISRYSYRSKVQRLPIEPISQASANQRAGRCGRVSEGICIRLYSEDDYNNRPEFTDPEILRTNLASVILQMLALGLGRIDAFPFVQPPDSRHINDGFRLLEELQATHKHKGRMVLSPMGRQIARLPVDPRYARMVIEAGQQNCVSEVLVIAAGLSIQDPRERPQDKRQAADECHQVYADKDSDFVGLLNLWRHFKQQQQTLSGNQLRKWCKQHYLNYLRMREWQDIVSQLKKSAAEVGLRLVKQEADYQSIHTAIASGLLSHIGFKDKEKEYLGARNTRFLIFPGSALSKKPPKWTMVAELVETSRLFGRMAARIDPAWVEGLATHLIKYQYDDPHWSKKQGAVIARQKVLLYGLTLVAGRNVAYANVDPALCHTLFIREALVNGETRLNMPFLAHNQQMVADVQQLEDKSRRRDILIDEDDLVAFYAQRLPEQVNSEASFKKWWKKHSQDPNALTFDPQDLRKQSDDHVTEHQYPDVWRQGNLRLPLSYHFDPRDPNDGVSVHIPLAMLNQVQPVEFDWLVPGFRHELIVTLIKGLPKRLRRNFVPAPNYADACLSAMHSRDKQDKPVAFLSALSHQLLRMTGVEVATEEWQTDALPAHLKMHFVVEDNGGKVIGQGRDLQALKAQLSGKVQDSILQAAEPDIEQSGCIDWQFDQIEPQYVSQQGAFEVKAYPALVAEKDSVGLRLFDQAWQAEQSHREGVRQLIMLNIPSPIKYLQDKLPNRAKLGLYFNPFGQVKPLIDDCIRAGLDHLMTGFCAEHNTDIRDAQTFEQLKEYCRGAINDEVLDIAEQVERILTLAHGIQKKLKGNVPLDMIAAHGHIKQRLSELVYPGFVSAVGAAKLADLQRYVQALAKRLEKLPIDPNRDRLQQLTIDKVQQQYQQHLTQLPKGEPVPEGLQDVQWMIEELHVSLFAQQLGTAYPISAKRIENHLASI
ncbi:ATP-dependent RNA helicase HrpA [Aestuariibacter halophilus]|uniref:ATP-dependent RNA helicase HrpA n=1 Tax=Fluctibacter halophilus TaxID=226011 RepID=A0ABS8G6Q6_9ALTE|nr:ATP-dependent RNA helicase HrpA [Aestuariibacter halophilus]MCC2615525.1 ATP-dependent RNA helicase HrpA [Aestuariibacter halophilus]